MKAGFQLEIGKQQAQKDTMKQTIDSMVNRLNELENVDRTQQEFIHEHDNTHLVNDPEITIIATNIIQEPSEDMLAIASELINSINESVNVVAATRLKSRGKGKPGLVNISMSNLEDKKLVLIEKRKLRQTEQYKSVFLRGSKSHTDRILELNARTLLNELSNGCQFRITSNGQIVKTSRQTRANNEHTETRNERDEYF